MAYQVPQNKEAFLKLCAESNTKFPYSEDISCLGNRRVWLNIIPDGLELEEKR